MKRHYGTNPPSFYDEEYFTKGTKSNYFGYNKESLLPRARRFVQDIRRSQTREMGKILILGSAKAFEVEAFLEAGYEAYGQDISFYAVHNATPYVKHFLTQSSVTHLPYKDESFDLIIAEDIFEHIEISWEANVQKEVFRVLTKQGMLLVSHPCGDEEVRKIESKEPSHFTIETPEWWIELFTKTGYTILSYSLKFGRTYLFLLEKP